MQYHVELITTDQELAGQLAEKGAAVREVWEQADHDAEDARLAAARAAHEEANRPDGYNGPWPPPVPMPGEGPLLTTEEDGGKVVRAGYDDFDFENPPVYHS